MHTSPHNDVAARRDTDHPRALTSLFVPSVVLALAIALATSALMAVPASVGAIAGGDQATEAQFKSIVALRLYQSPDSAPFHRCSGTLIDEFWVVTAGHCMNHPNSPEKYTIVAGELDREVVESGEQEVNVAEIFVYGTAPNSDLALLRLETAVVANHRVEFARIGTMPPESEKRTFWEARPVRLAGWGITSQDRQGLYERHLRHVEVWPYCDRNGQTGYGSGFCVAGTNPGKSACRQDSGGPAYLEPDGRPQLLVGVISYGTACGDQNIITHIGAYEDWIVAHMRRYRAVPQTMPKPEAQIEWRVGSAPFTPEDGATINVGRASQVTFKLVPDSISHVEHANWRVWSPTQVFRWSGKQDDRAIYTYDTFGPGEYKLKVRLWNDFGEEEDSEYTLIVEGEPPGSRLGDVNCDEVVNVVDALKIMRWVVGFEPGDVTCPPPGSSAPVNLSNGDVNGSGGVDTVDALFIMQCEVGLTNAFCP